MTAQHGDVATGPGWELRCGRWQDVLADVTECDALITDPPYSPRVHAGQRTGSRPLGGGGRKTTITYDCITEADCDEFAAHWSSRVRHWLITFSDHTGARWWDAALSREGLYTFAPVIWLRENPTPRLAGDGPTSAADYLTVARPRHPVRGERAGSRPGYYIVSGNIGSETCHVGGKPLGAMRQIIRDYTRKGDLIVDPCAGGGTTLLAAVMEGRRAIGAEMDPATFDKAVARLRKGFTTPLPGMEAPRMEQTGLDL